MDGSALDGIWLASLVAAAGMGWIVGRARAGAAVAMPSEVADASADGEVPVMCAALAKTGQETAAPPDPRIFQDMPPVENVRAQAEAIRREADLWKTPGLAVDLQRTERWQYAQRSDPFAIFQEAASMPNRSARLGPSAGSPASEPIALSIGSGSIGSGSIAGGGTKPPTPTP
jgi:hypothetical protein